MRANHTILISRVCPKSGWEINNNNVGNNTKLVIKYLKYKLFLLRHNKVETKIIKKGLINSIGWNLGKKPRSNHLFDPLTSIPIKGTKIKNKKEMKNRIIEILNKKSSLKNENTTNMNAPRIINIKCFIKK